MRENAPWSSAALAHRERIADARKRHRRESAQAEPRRRSRRRAHRFARDHCFGARRIAYAAVRVGRSRAISLVLPLAPGPDGRGLGGCCIRAPGHSTGGRDRTSQLSRSEHGAPRGLCRHAGARGSRALLLGLSNTRSQITRWTACPGGISSGPISSSARRGALRWARRDVIAAEPFRAAPLARDRPEIVLWHSNR